NASPNCFIAVIGERAAGGDGRAAGGISGGGQRTAIAIVGVMESRCCVCAGGVRWAGERICLRVAFVRRCWTWKGRSWRHVVYRHCGRVFGKAVVLVNDSCFHRFQTVVIERTRRSCRSAAACIRSGCQGSVGAIVGVVETCGCVGAGGITLRCESYSRGAALVDWSIVGKPGRRGDVVYCHRGRIFGFAVVLVANFAFYCTCTVVSRGATCSVGRRECTVARTAIESVGKTISRIDGRRIRRSR